jgi:hypothetical protein
MSFSEFIQTDGLSRIEIRDLLSGDIGTPVVLRLERQGKTVDVGLVRGLARIDNGWQPSPENEAPSTQVGLGLAIEIAEEGCTVLNTVVGGGAHSCGKISTGDLLIAVLDRSRSTDFVPTNGLDFNQVRNMILGAPGSKVTLKMQSRSKGGAVYLCEDLIRGTQVDALNSPQPKAPPAVASPANPAPAPVRAPLPPPPRNAAPPRSPPDARRRRRGSASSWTWTRTPTTPWSSPSCRARRPTAAAASASATSSSPSRARPRRAGPSTRCATSSSGPSARRSPSSSRAPPARTAATWSAAPSLRRNRSRRRSSSPRRPGR